MARHRDKKWEEISKGTTDIGRLIYAYEIRNKTLNRSPKTTAWYSNNLRLFKDFLVANGYSLAIGDIGIQEVREYIVYLQQRKRFQGHPLTPVKDQKLSPQTIRAHVETLKAFFTWLYTERYTQDNRLEKLEFPKVPKKYVDVLSEEEKQKILASIDQNSEFGARNLAVVIMLLDTGLRLAELINLRLGDTHIEQGYVRVMGKGARNKSRSKLVAFLKVSSISMWCGDSLKSASLGNTENIS
jgi:site-specific recombinase XerD